MQYCMSIIIITRGQCKENKKTHVHKAQETNLNFHLCRISKRKTTITESILTSGMTKPNYFTIDVRGVAASTCVRYSTTQLNKIRPRPKNVQAHLRAAL